MKFIFKKMVVIINSSRYFVKQHGYGLGNIKYKSIKGDGILRDSIKNLGKLLFSSGRKVFRFIKPRAIAYVKDTLKDIKPKVEDTVVDKSTKLIHNVFNKPKELKQTSKEIIKEIADESKEKIIPLVQDNIKNTLQKSYFDLIHKKGAKRDGDKSSNRKPLNKNTKELLKIISK